MLWFRNKVFLIGINSLLPVLLILSIWLPMIYHYYVPGIHVTEKMIDSGRQIPDDKILKEINTFFDLSQKKNRKIVIAKAEKILHGEVGLKGDPSQKVRLPTDIHEINNASNRLRYPLFLLQYPRILIDAYEITRRDDFLLAARDMIMLFASYERTRWLPKGHLWSDGVIAQRIAVLAKFWEVYRNHPGYQPEVARKLFQLVARSSQLLAEPGHFNFATNHGIMQNLALWQVCLAFPSLPNNDFYKQVAFKRMREQMHFYIDDEGVVLEHSPGYQSVGLRFLDLAIRYAALLNLQIPDEWKIKYSKAKKFYAQLIRPDGSMPMLGDTEGGRGSPVTLAGEQDVNDNKRQSRDKSWIIKQSHSLYPIAGYSIWWDGLGDLPKEQTLSQTVVAWSYFPGHAHKHADEMSVLLWSNGCNWWTNVGYWPYGAKGRSNAISWAGSNAPHLINESTDSVRLTRLMSYAWSDNLAELDLERKGPHDYVARRQVIHINPNLWIVLDNTFGNKGSRTATTWTTSYNVKLSRGKLPGSYILEPEDSKVKLTKFILTSEGSKISQFKGSFSPFAGWESHKSADAIVVEQPADDSWAATIWLLRKSDRESRKFIKTPFMEHWKNSEDWKIGLPLSSGLMNIWRKDNRLFVKKNTRGIETQAKLQLSEPAQITDKRAEIQSAYRNTEMKYHQKAYSVQRRLKLSYFLIFLFALQEGLFFMYGRYRGKYYTALRGVSAFGWMILGIFILMVYL